MTRKRSRQAPLEKESSFISSENREGDSVVRESMQNMCKKMASGKKKLLDSCTEVNDQSGVASAQNADMNKEVISDAKEVHANWQGNSVTATGQLAADPQSSGLRRSNRMRYNSSRLKDFGG
ncbi:hypothetical protein PIB30_063168 [Stylosanthes scabra]|uniref:Uncharacterized protein n=1 Tax=Stylosanthes scabra TaxID=79078 RepID=A0ABU6YIU6_9FABA|nr:hypothetical protein [Stylosanthes scabra]